MNSKLSSATFNPNFENQPYCKNGASSIIINKCTNKVRLNTDCLKRCDLNNSEPNITERKDSIKHILHGDLYVIGRFWIDAMKAILTGTKSSLFKIPTVEAANKKSNENERTKFMKYTDLPLEGELQASLKDIEEEKRMSEIRNTRILQSIMLPYVTCARKCAQDICSVIKSEAIDTKNELSEFIGEKKDFIVDFFRNPDNMNERYAAVALGGIGGFLYAYRKGLPSKAFYTIAGLLAAGALCFPEETDRNFKNSLYYGAQGVVILYNIYSGDNYKLPGKLPCKERDDGKSPIKQLLKPNLCPNGKKK